MDSGSALASRVSAGMTACRRRRRSDVIAAKAPLRSALSGLIGMTGASWSFPHVAGGNPVALR